jgi:response regulator of citrate/malate metabolism
MEFDRVTQKEASEVEMIAITEYNKNNEHFGRQVVTHANKTYILGTANNGEENRKILENLPKVILNNYVPDSLRFSPLLRDHNDKDQFLVLTGVPRN